MIFEMIKLCQHNGAIEYENREGVVTSLDYDSEIVVYNTDNIHHISVPNPTIV